MNSKLEEYIKNCDEKYDFAIIEDTTDEAYEKITRPHLKDCKNPDGSGPNKDRVPESKITNGFT